MRRLHADMHNHMLAPKQRHAADKAIQKINAQIRDKRLMALRERLMRAAQARDSAEIARITLQIKDYEGEELESGHYGI